MAAITISRQFGAGGRSLGERLCERFGFHLVDEIAIDELARKAKVSGDWLTAMEKEASSTLLGLLSGIVSHGLLYRNPAAPDKEFERKKYIAFLRSLMSQTCSPVSDITQSNGTHGSGGRAKRSNFTLSP